MYGGIALKKCYLKVKNFTWAAENNQWNTDLLRNRQRHSRQVHAPDACSQ